MRVVLSLDTELAWGRPSEDKRIPLFADSSAGRNAFDYILDVFDHYRIPVTWAVVGHLFLEECSPDTHYRADHIDSIDPFSDHDRDPLFYAPDIIERILDASVDHEVAGHSFSHPRFSELTVSQARTELEAMASVFDDRGLDLRSIVHPNIDIEHLELLPEYGIEVYSGGQPYGNFTLLSGLSKFLRRDPAMFEAPLTHPSRDKHDLLEIPRSRNLRDERWGWLNPRRIENAIESGDDGVLHLTFHPHNLIYDPNLKRTLPTIASMIDRKRRADDLTVHTFADLADIL